MTGYLLAGFAAALLLTNGLTWHYTQKAGAARLAAFKAQVKAEGVAKENDNARVQAAAKASAAKVHADAQIAEGKAWAAAVAADAEIKRLGGRVRNLTDARSVLGAGGSGSSATVNPPASLRGDQGHSEPDLPGRLAACEDALTLSTVALKYDIFYLNLSEIGRRACVRQYNEVRDLYNEGEQR